MTDGNWQATVKDQKGYSETQAYNLLYSGGLTIVSTQDLTIQQICDEVTSDPDYYPTTEYGLEFALTIHRADGTAENYSKEQLKKFISENIDSRNPLVFSSEDEAMEAIEAYKDTLNIDEEAGDTVDENYTITLQPQVSFVVMDQATGYVKAIVGGRGTKTGNRTLNRATAESAAQQPGSCFKILSTYGPGLDQGQITLATPVEDKPYKYESGQEVHNSNNRYIGWTTVRNAIKQSINTCAVETLTEVVGPAEGYEYVKDNFNITTIVEDDMNQALALGGITNGVRNIDITAAFASIANQGTYTDPVMYTQILDHDGNVLIDNSVPSTHQAIKDSTAYLLTSAMEDVVNGGTGTSARLDNMATAGKTGSTNDYADRWFCGFTPYYTASIWGGYDENKSMSGMGSWHLRIWNTIMERIHSDLDEKDFEVPSSVKKATICRKTGLLAVSSCPTVTEYFATDELPDEHCSGHVVSRPSTPSGGSSSDSSTSGSSGSSSGSGSGTTTTPPDSNTGGGGAESGGGTESGGGGGAASGGGAESGGEAAQ